MQTNPFIDFSPIATEQIRSVGENKADGKQWWLRVSVSWPRGSASPFHHLSVDLDPPRPDEQLFRCGQIGVVVAIDQIPMLKGTSVDFKEENGQRGLKFENPNFESEDANKWWKVLSEKEQN